jgi:hypothetical protein
MKKQFAAVSAAAALTFTLGSAPPPAPPNADTATARISTTAVNTAVVRLASAVTPASLVLTSVTHPAASQSTTTAAAVPDDIAVGLTIAVGVALGLVIAPIWYLAFPATLPVSYGVAQLLPFLSQLASFFSTGCECGPQPTPPTPQQLLGETLAIFLAGPIVLGAGLAIYIAEHISQAINAANTPAASGMPTTPASGQSPSAHAVASNRRAPSAALTAGPVGASIGAALHDLGLNLLADINALSNQPGPVQAILDPIVNAVWFIAFPVTIPLTSLAVNNATYPPSIEPNFNWIYVLPYFFMGPFATAQLVAPPVSTASSVQPSAIRAWTANVKAQAGVAGPIPQTVTPKPLAYATAHGLALGRQISHTAPSAHSDLSRTAITSMSTPSKKP